MALIPSPRTAENIKFRRYTRSSVEATQLNQVFITIKHINQKLANSIKILNSLRVKSWIHVKHLDSFDTRESGRHSAYTSLVWLADLASGKIGT